MTKKNVPSILATLLSLAVIAAVLVGCQASEQQAAAQDPQPAEEQTASFDGGGELALRVNPEFTLRYDEAGKVVDVVASNDSAKTIAIAPVDYEGKDARAVVSWLVTKIHEAGLLVDVETGEGRTIHLEVSAGSALPSDDFLRSIVSDTQTYVVGQSIVAPMEVTGHETYGWTDYGDSDYGPESDGVTDYYDTDYGPLNDGETNYDDTDYGPNNDGVTDYNDTDYGPNNDGVTDYDDTDYGPNNDGVTDYSAPAQTTSAPTPEPEPEPAPDPVPTPAPSTPTSGGDSNYGNSNYGNSNYGNSGYSDSGNSGYGDSGNSGYGDSGYDD